MGFYKNQALLDVKSEEVFEFLTLLL
jgi:hypothetical protein